MWVVDPKTKEPSVSLTLLVCASTLMMGAIILDYFKVVKSTSLLDEFFMVSVSLYFGRRASWGGSDGASGSLGEDADTTRRPQGPPSQPPLG